MSADFYDFAIIGGDLRQVYMANILSKKGWSVIVYGLEAEQDVKGCTIAQSLVEAVVQSKIIVGPIALTKDQQTICSKKDYKDLNVELLCDTLRPHHKFFAGCIPKNVAEACKSKNILPYDFMEDEPLAVFNTIATAEGAILEALTRHDTNLHKSSCLVLGYGRCAKILADKLKGLSANVTVCVRSEQARAYADAYGCSAITFDECARTIGDYEYIFNTVPSLVIGRDMLGKLDSSSVIIDIASFPGGVDYDAAQEFGVSAHLCLSLPGKYAPKSSAAAMVDTLLSSL